MILQLFEALGVNPYFVFDLIFIGFVIMGVYILYLSQLFKGMILPFIRANLKKENVAFIETGGIEIQVKNYKRNTESLSYSDKKDSFNWPIPKGIEQMLPNKIKFVLASTGLGVCYNIGILSRELDEIKKVLSPKIIANTIDDRSKVMADHLTKDYNKVAMVGGVLGILFVVAVFLYLIVMKGLEYDVCRHAIATAKQVSTTTINSLPPLD